MGQLCVDSERGRPVRTEFAVPSGGAILFRSLIAGIIVLALALSIQWLIYFDWMHEPGPLEVAGSVLAGVLMFVLVFRSQYSVRHRKIELIARLEAIRWMNDRIRNSLQTIECVTYAAAPNATGCSRRRRCH